VNPSPKNTDSKNSGILFVDANALLEIVLDRPKQRLVRKLLGAAKESFATSALAAHLVVHFGVERVGLPALKQLLSDYTILSLTSEDFAWAFANVRDKDFEDALQLAVAIRHGCARFVTFDQQLYKTYRDLPSIRVELLK
jgi:predicted nucleic acid-binding protein